MIINAVYEIYLDFRNKTILVDKYSIIDFYVQLIFPNVKNDSIY